MPRPDIKTHKYVVVLLTIMLIIGGFIKMILMSRPDHSLINDLKRPAVVEKATIVANGIEQEQPLPSVVNTNQPFTEILDLSEIDDLSGKSLALFIAYTDFHAVADGKVFYRYEVDKNSPIRSGGYSIHMVDLPDELAEKKVELHYTPLLSSVEYYKLTPVEVGRHINVFMTKLIRELWLYLIIVVLLAFFITTMAAALIDWDLLQREGRMLPLGVLSLCMAFFLLPQMWTFNYLLNRYHLAVYLMEYTALMLLAVPAIVLVREKLDRRYRNLLLTVNMLLFANLIIQYALTFTGLIEFKELLPLDHGLLILSGAVAVIAFLGTDAKTHPDKKILLLSLSPLILFMLINVSAYWFTDRFGLFEMISLGVAVFVVMQLYSAIVSYKAVTERIVRNRFFEQLALKDALTGLDNRTAFVKFRDEERQTKRSCVVISIDLNDLKMVNDTYGHLAGDRTLQLFADVLRQAMEAYPSARVFRTGGDEFIAFVFEPDFDFSSWLTRMREMRDQAMKGQSGVSLSFAAGYHLFDKDNGHELDDVINESDKRMYAHKATVKGLAR